jgi:hypothetical protein
MTIYEKYMDIFIHTEKLAQIDSLPNERIKNLRTILNKHSKEQVNEFIDELQWLLKFRQYLINNREELDEHRKQFKRIKKHIKAVLEDLKLIYKKQFSLLLPLKFDDLHGDKIESDDTINHNAIIAAEMAFNSLFSFLVFLEDAQDVLDEDRSGRGRKSADHDGFIREIAFLFNEKLGMPTTYPYSDFFMLIQELYNILGLPSEDPSRAVISAVNAIKEDKKRTVT